MIDTAGITFLFRMTEETGASVANIAQAWLEAREILGMPAFWRQVESLNGQADITTQITLLHEGRKLTEHATRWLLHNRRPQLGIQATASRLADGVQALRAGLPRLLIGKDMSAFEYRRKPTWL